MRADARHSMAGGCIDNFAGGACVAARAAGVFEKRVPLDRLAAYATEIALAVNHPPYDCFYLALAVVCDIRVVSATAGLFSAFGRRPGNSGR